MPWFWWKLLGRHAVDAQLSCFLYNLIYIANIPYNQILLKPSSEITMNLTSVQT